MTDQARYMRVFERMLALLRDANIPEAEAYDLAGKTAYDATRDFWLDKADALKDRMKENGTWGKAS